MSAVPTKRFVDELTSLDHDEFCEFVADIWEASGWETEIRTPLVIAEKETRTERLLVAPSGRLRRLLSFDIPEHVDTVVSPRIEDDDQTPYGFPDVPVIDASALRHRLLYALDDDVATGICRDRLELDLRGRYDQSPRSVPLQELALGAVAVLLVAVGVVSLLGIGPLTGDTQPVEPSGETTFDSGYDAPVSPVDAQTTIQRPGDVPDGNVAYYTTTNGTVRALNVDTGSLLWEHRLLNDSNRAYSHRPASPIVVDGTVYVSAFDGVYALDARTGAVQWSYEHGNPATFQPTVVEETLYVTAGTDIIALDTQSGAEQWRVSLPSRVGGTPTVKDGRVYLSTVDGIFYALDGETGEKRISAASPGKSYISRSAVVVEGDDSTSDSYLVSGVETISAIDTATGDNEWTYDAPWTVLGMTVDRNGNGGDAIYVGTPSSGLIALNATKGDLRWVFNDYRDRRMFTPAVATWTAVSNGSQTTSNRTVFVPATERNGNGTLHALEASSGEERWLFDFERGTPITVTVADGVVYVPMTTGRLYALDAATGERRWVTNTTANAAFAPTVVRSPLGGDSIDSAVRLGAQGHHDGLYRPEKETEVISLLDHDSPGTVAPGEEGRISMLVLNAGRNTTEATVELNAAWSDRTINRSIELGPSQAGEYTTVFPAPDQQGTYEYELRVGDQRRSGTATVVEDPAHEIVSVDAQSAVWRGDRTEVLVTVRNVDKVAGTTPLALEFDGEIVDRTARTVAGNETVTVTFAFEVDETLAPGEYTFAVATADDVQLSTMEVRTVDDRTLARSLVAQIVGATLVVVGLALVWWLLVRLDIRRFLTESPSKQ